jgi:hypothetical protein
MTGGDFAAVAIRIARDARGRKTVEFRFLHFTEGQ